jgi:hypothetical protein
MCLARDQSLLRGILVDEYLVPILAHDGFVLPLVLEPAHVCVGTIIPLPFISSGKLFHLFGFPE